MRWKGLDRKLAGAVVTGIRYEPDSGYLIVELIDGREIWLSGDREGGHVFLDQAQRKQSSHAAAKGVTL